MCKTVFVCRCVRGRATGEDPVQQEGFSAHPDGGAAPGASRYETCNILIINIWGVSLDLKTIQRIKMSMTNKLS